ncbi:hypothetical protein C8R43DRAFT_1113459 [Mycena crocata]|nr:hypothetical protein C8R43DRAFT_1113459 [Mycena crocata]
MISVFPTRFLACGRCREKENRSQRLRTLARDARIAVIREEMEHDASQANSTSAGVISSSSRPARDIARGSFRSDTSAQASTARDHPYIFLENIGLSAHWCAAQGFIGMTEKKLRVIGGWEERRRDENIAKLFPMMRLLDRLLFGQAMSDLAARTV